MNQFCMNCGGEYTNELPCICSLLESRISSRRESTMNRIKKYFVRIENRLMESVYQIIESQCHYTYNLELKNLWGYKMRYAFTSLNRTNHVLYAIDDVIAHSELKVRLAYAYNMKLARLVALDTMDAINSELEFYTKGI